MRKILGILAVVLLLALLSSGVIADAAKFFAWLFLMENTLPQIPIWAEVVVRVLSVLVSYSLVGVIFSFFGVFNKKLMSIAYVVVSTLVLILGTYMIWALEQFITIIIVILSIVLVLSIVAVVFLIIWYLKDDNNTEESDEEVIEK